MTENKQEMTEMTPHKQKYSRIDMLINGLVEYISGGLVGGAQGIVGAFAVPTSIRRVNDSLDETLDVTFNDKTFPNGMERTAIDGLRSAIYHYHRLTARVVLHGAAIYAMAEDIISEGNMDGMENIVNSGTITFGYLAIPNTISVGYEIYRFAKRRHDSKQVE